jgi:flagellar basal-body rod protein FlgF
MPYGLYLSAEGAQAQSRRLEVIANNMANVDTVGFKRDLAICQARYAEAISQGLRLPDSGSIDDVGGGITVRETKTDFSTGPLRRTDNPADVAIDGDAFFEVKKGDETFLTRAGNFRLTAGGQLITQQGYAVLSDSGTPIVIAPANGPFEISDSGSVRQRDTAPQNLALVRPTSPNNLSKMGENMFRPLADPEALTPDQRHVAPGFIELSTVRPTSEMTDMIETSRLFEANVNMMKTQDQMINELVSRMLKA